MTRRFSSAGWPVALLLSMTIHAHSAELVHLYAAGSLREALAQLQSWLRSAEPSPAPVWPFRRPPSEA